MASGITELLDQLYTQISDAWALPLSTEKCILDRGAALALLDEIKAQLPNEVAEAKRIIGAKAELIRKTKEEVDQIRQNAGDEARRIVEREAIVQAAKKRAEEIISGAEAKAAELRKASNAYTDELLRRTEESLGQSLENIRKSRSSFRSTTSQNG